MGIISPDFVAIESLRVKHFENAHVFRISISMFVDDWTNILDMVIERGWLFR